MPSTDTPLDLLGACADRETRGDAARALAHRLGAEDVKLFSADPELGSTLPALGTPQTLRGAAQWRSFLSTCLETRSHVDTMEIEPGESALVHGRASADGTVIAVIGGAPGTADLDALTPVLPVLGRLFTAERVIQAIEARAARAASAASRAAVLAQTLDEMRQRLETALGDAQDARASAEEANLAKSAFLATMSHELRTPLNAMIGYADLLQMGIPVKIPEESAQMVSRISLSARHLLELIEEILTFSKLEAGEEVINLEIVPLQIIIDEVIALSEPLTLVKGLVYETDIRVGDTQINTDPRKLRQILVNLLGNAAKFTSEGKVRFEAYDEMDNFVFRVTDTGMGIVAADLEQIFEPFWQSNNGTTRTAGGTGLGLTITRRLARLLGGDVRVTSELEHGTMFEVRLPRN